MIHILKELFHKKVKVQVLRCLPVVMLDYQGYSLCWFSSCVTGIICTVFSSGGTISSEITILELVGSPTNFPTVEKAMFTYLQLFTEE